MKQFKQFFAPSISSIFCAIVLVLATSSVSVAQQSIKINDKDMNADIVPRISPADADIAITSREGYVNLLIHDDMLIIQFSDKKLDEIANEIQNEVSDENQEHFIAVLKSMISGGVRTLLDRGLAIPLYEISEVSYTNGKLIILNQTGNDIFKDVEIDDKPLMEQFSRRDARRFVTEVERRII